MSADAAVLSFKTAAGKLWSEIEVSDDEFQAEAVLPAKSPVASTSTSTTRRSPHTPGRRLPVVNERSHHRSNNHHRHNRRAGAPHHVPSPAPAPAPINPDVPRKRRFANIASLDVLLDWPRTTSSNATTVEEAAALPPSPSPLLSPKDEDSSTTIPLSASEDCSSSSHSPSAPSSPLNSSSTPLFQSAEEISNEASAEEERSFHPEPSDPPFQPSKATDHCRPSPATFEGRMRGWTSSNPTSSPEPPSDTECASQISETARPLEGHLTEEDGDVIFHQPFEIWYTLPAGGAHRKGINKEVYEGGMHKIGTFTRVSEFFEFHRMLDWNTLPPNSVIAFCRENIRPIWEDPANEVGGRYLVKNFPRDNTEAIFTKTALGFFSGLLHDWTNYNLVSLHIRDARRGNDIQLWRRTVRSALSADIVKEDILSITSEEGPTNLVVSFVPNRESLCRNDERLAHNSSSRKGRNGRSGGNGSRSPVGPATVESVFGSTAAARSVSSLYSKGRGFSLSAEEKERMVEECAQEAARMGAKLSETFLASPRAAAKSEAGSSLVQCDETGASSPRSELSREFMGEALTCVAANSTGTTTPPLSSTPSAISTRRREPIPDMVHPAQLMTAANPMMGYYYVPSVAPTFACMVRGAAINGGLNHPQQPAGGNTSSTAPASAAESSADPLLLLSSEENIVMGAGSWAQGYPVYWHSGPLAPNARVCPINPQYAAAAYYSAYTGGCWSGPMAC